MSDFYGIVFVLWWCALRWVEEDSSLSQSKVRFLVKKVAPYHCTMVSNRRKGCINTARGLSPLVELHGFMKGSRAEADSISPSETSTVDGSLEDVPNM